MSVWSSRKLWMTLLGVGIVYSAYWHSLMYLQSVESDKVEAFSHMYRDMMVSISAIVLGYLGINGVISWKHGPSVLSQAQEMMGVDTPPIPEEEEEEGDPKAKKTKIDKGGDS